MIPNSFFQLEPKLPGYPVVWSADRKYRYTLWRVWTSNPRPRYIVWVGLNPSKATERVNDNTVCRCIKFSKKWGFEAMAMMNLFALRSTDPKGLVKVDDPVGSFTDKWLRKVIRGSHRTVACWGGKKWSGIGNRDEHVRKLIQSLGKDLYVLRMNNDGSPLHPLFSKSDSELVKW